MPRSPYAEPDEEGIFAKKFVSAGRPQGGSPQLWIVREMYVRFQRSYLDWNGKHGSAKHYGGFRKIEHLFLSRTTSAFGQSIASAKFGSVAIEFMTPKLT